MPGVFKSLQTGLSQTLNLVVSAFNGRTGAVVPTAGDYTATQVTVTPAINGQATVQLSLADINTRLTSASALASAAAPLASPSFTGTVTFANDPLLSGSETGLCGIRFRSAAASQPMSYNVTFRTRRSSVPTVSLGGGITANLAAGSPAVAGITANGFRFDLIANLTATDTYALDGTYTAS